MGGRLFNGKRLDREDFYVVEEEVVSWLKKELKAEDVVPLQQLSDKESFGDLDLIVSSKLAKGCHDLLEKSEIQFKRNGDVLSFLWKDFQVDLIFVSPKMIPFSVSYFSHGDKSALLGRLIKHHYKITFSSKGPYCKISFNNGDYTAKVFLEDPEGLDYDSLVFKLLGLPPCGIVSQKELFDWVISSPLFTPEIYDLEKLSSEQRRRDKERSFYLDWLGYLATIDKPVYSNPSFVTNHLYSLYPEYLKEVRRHSNLYQEERRVREILSGKVIHEITGLEGKALGDFIKYLKRDHLQRLKDRKITIREAYDFYKKS